MRALLIPLDGGESIELVKDLTLVGRKEDCDLRLEHKSVSKLHCVILKADGTLIVRDLGSTNNTRVNGQRVRRLTLYPNDQLTIASYKYRVQFGGDDNDGAQPNEYTQHLDAHEVVKLLQRVKDGKDAKNDAVESEADSDSGDDSAVIQQPVVQNPLPDVYPEEKPRKAP